MEINKENFEVIVERLFDRLEIVDKKIERLLNQDACLKGDELLDNQDLIGMLKEAIARCNVTVRWGSCHIVIGMVKRIID